MLASAAVVMVQACGSASAPTGDPGGNDSAPATGYASGAVTLQQVNARISATALEYWQSGLAASRAGFYDIAYPKDATEFDLMAGHGLMLVSLIVRDSTEIPPQRVYVRSSAGDAVLQPLFGVSSQIDPTDSLVVAILGEYRHDTMYLFPVSLKFAEGVLLVDFASNREEFFLDRFPGMIPAALETLPRDRPSGLPTYEYTRTMIQREYPGLLDWFLALCGPPAALTDGPCGITTSKSVDW